MWVCSSANSEAAAGCRPLGYIPSGLAFGGLPGDPSGDTTAGWRRAEQINSVGKCRTGMVDGGDLGRTTVERGGEPIESIVGIGVGEVASEPVEPIETDWRMTPSDWSMSRRNV